MIRKNEVHKVARPPNTEVKRSVQALIEHLQLHIGDLQTSRGAGNAPLEPRKDEFGINIVSHPINRFHRGPICVPGIWHLFAMDWLALGHQLPADTAGHQ